MLSSVCMYVDSSHMTVISCPMEQTQPTFKLLFNAMTLQAATILAARVHITDDSCAIHTYIHPHPFNGPLSGTTRVSRYQIGKTNVDFTEATGYEWQWHQLGHMQVCTSLQTDNHASTQPLCFFYRPDALPAAQLTVSKH